jgi:hypothetical protein
MRRRTRKDWRPSEGEPREDALQPFCRQPEDTGSITEDDVERAWQRFTAAVAAEPVPEVWLRAAGDGRSAGPAIEPDAAGVSPAVGPIAPVDSVEPVEHSDESVGPVQTPVWEPAAGPALRTRHRHRHLGRRWRWAATAAAAVLVAGGLFFTPAGDRVLAAAMQTLYFNQLMGVGQTDLTQIQMALEENGHGQIDLSQYGTVDRTGGDRLPHQLTLAEARRTSGLPVPVLPQFDPTRDHVTVTGGSVLTFRLHVDAINRLITLLGGTHTFPQAIDDQPIVVNIGPEVLEQATDTSGHFIALNETAVPTVQVPEHVDLEAVREALIGLPFLPGDIRQSLMQSGNWRQTLYLPVGGKPQAVSVDGHPAIAVLAQTDGGNASISWLANGVLYQLSGSSQVFPTVDSLIQQAEALGT